MKLVVLPRCPDHPCQLGPSSRPPTPALGDAVQTPKVLRSLALEGRNQDGLVDLAGQAVVTAVAPVTYTHAVSSVGVPASTELLTKTAVVAPAIQYVAAPLTPFVRGIPVAATAAAPAAEKAAGVKVA